MTNQTSIKYISALLENPGSISDGDQGSISLFRQTFPYFVPTRYLVALEAHKKAAFTPQMLSGIHPYVGDWMMFCDFLDAGLKPVPAAKVVDKKMVDIHPQPEQPVPVVVATPEPKVAEAVAEVIEIPPVEAVAKVIEMQAATGLPAAPPPVEDIAPPVMPEVPAPVAEEVSPFSFAPVIAVVEERPEIPAINRIKEEIVNEIHVDPVHVPVAEPAAQAEEIIQQPVAEVVPEPVSEIQREEPATAEVYTAPVAEYVAQVEEAEVPHEAVPAEPEAVIPPIVDSIVPHAVETDLPYAEVIPVVENTVANTVPVDEPVMNDQADESAFAKAWAELESGAAAKEEAPEGSALEIVGENGATVESLDSQEDELIFPIYTRDYFLQQGEKVSDEIPLEINELRENRRAEDDDRALMVVMSFSEWLLHFKNSSERQREESKDQKALKTMWQKEKLAAAIEEENEEIPETVFEMAVNSISKEETLVSETLAEIHIKQGKYDKAIEMYRKLSLRNPQKSAYFARKIEEALKDKQS